MSLMELFEYIEVILSIRIFFLCANCLHYCKIKQIYGDSIKSMWKCPREVYISSASQDVLCILWILKFHICGLCPEPYESNSHCPIMVILRPILILYIHLCLDLFFWFYYQTLHAFLFCDMSTICPAHIIVRGGDKVMHIYCNTVNDMMLRCIALVLSEVCRLDYRLSHPPVICHVCLCVCGKSAEWAMVTG